MIQRNSIVFGVAASMMCLVVGCSERTHSDSEKNVERGAGNPTTVEGSAQFDISWRVGYGVTAEAEKVAVLEKITREVLSDSEGKLAGLDRGTIIVSGQLDAADKEHRVVIEGDLRASRLELGLHAGVMAAGQVAAEGDLDHLVRNAVRDLERALGEMVDLSRKGPDAWRRALLSAEADIQVFACRLLATHKDESAIADIAGLLRDPRSQVAEAAAGALVAIGSQDAVPLLLENIERGNVRSEVRAIEALGKLGGDDAVAYLEMVAEGHEIPEVRRVAGLALETARSNR